MVRAIVLFEWAVLAFLCSLCAALEGMLFFTKCPDSRLLARLDELIGERGMLFRLSAGLVDLIRSVGVADILEGTASDATDAEQLLTFADGVYWSGRLDFMWFSCNRQCTLPMPSGVEAEVGATDGAAALDLADAYHRTSYSTPPRAVRCPTMRLTTYSAPGEAASSSDSVGVAGATVSPGLRGILVTQSILTRFSTPSCSMRTVVSVAERTRNGPSVLGRGLR